MNEAEAEVEIDDLMSELWDAVEARDPNSMDVVYSTLRDVVNRSASEEEEDGEQISGGWRPNKVIIIEPPEWA